MERYAELRESKDTSRSGLSALVMLADLDLAITRISPEEYEVVLLHGLIGFTTREAGALLDMPHNTLSRAYLGAVATLTRYMNGDGG